MVTKAGRPSADNPSAQARSPKRRPSPSPSPGLANERALWDDGHQIVVGMDEVGRGAWAGPLTLAAVVIPRHRRIYKVRDSKQLTEARREALFDRVTDWCETWAVGHASAEECDRLGMSAAQRLAGRRALDGLGCEPDRVLLDGRLDFVGTGNVDTIVKGDATCLSIAAASVLAKVTRDRIMRATSEDHPWWWFDQNKDYPCPRHQASLRGVGPSAIHRRSWAVMDSLPWAGVARTRRADPPAALV